MFSHGLQAGSRILQAAVILTAAILQPLTAGAVLADEPVSAPAAPAAAEPATAAAADGVPAVTAEKPVAPGILPDQEKSRPLATSGRYLLAYKFQPNQRVYYQVTHTMKIVTRKSEAVETTTNESKTTKHYRVFNVDSEGNGLLELIIDQVQMKAQFGSNEPVAVDSNDPENVPAAYRDVIKTIGRPLARIKISPAGELLSAVRVLDRELQEQVSAGSTPEATSDNDASRNFLVVFPDYEIAPGESWTDRSLEVRVRVGRSLSRPVQLLRTYTLESVKDGIATIQLKTAVLTPVNDPAIRAQLIQRTPSGTIRFNIEDGLISAREMRVDDSVIGPFGDDSSLKATSLRTETLTTQPVMEARRNAGPANLPETDKE